MAYRSRILFSRLQASVAANCLCAFAGSDLRALRKRLRVLIISAGAERKRGRDGQESCIVVRGGKVALWGLVEALFAESVFELVEW